MVRKRIGCILLMHIKLATLLAQNPKADSVFINEMKHLHVAGAQACAIDSGKITWRNTYGFQNIEKQTKVTEKTLFDIASVTKTITGAAIAQLLAQKKVKLDEDINLYLDFEVRNPHYPIIPITIGELLRHRSSIVDNSEYMAQFWDYNKGDPKIPLNTFLKEYLTPKGKAYNKQKNFCAYAPNAASKYCNVGIALLGYIVERVSKRPFSVYCKENIFKPLAMYNTGWFYHEIDSEQVAMPYSYNDSTSRYMPLGHGGFPDYPSGALKSNTEELSHFLIAWTHNGNWKNNPVFDSTAIQQITPADINLGFYLWFLMATGSSSLLYCHSGAGGGISSFICYNPKNNKGLIILTNGEIFDRKDWLRIINGLYSTSFK